VSAVIVAAGQGARFGQPNKTFVKLGGRPVVVYVLDAMQSAQSITSVVLVAGAHTLDHAEALRKTGQWSKLRAVVPGGIRRQDSVRAGLLALPGDATLVAIHDGARPFVEPRHIDDCVALAQRSGAAMLAIPVIDTIKEVVGGFVERTVPRERLWAAQTPQVFDVSMLSQALDAANREGRTVTDEASLFETFGHKVAIFEGSRYNLKLTVPEDFALAEALLAAHQVRGGKE
jgi:2-C-methyl-D-erythritol 4-phosphate cytidylyltransferase